jgi:hypothetical protein
MRVCSNASPEPEEQMKVLRDWIGVVVVVASIIFQAGYTHYQIGAVEAQVQSIREEYARRDVLEKQLELIDVRISTIQNSNERTEKKMDELLRYVK